MAPAPRGQCPRARRERADAIVTDFLLICVLYTLIGWLVFDAVWAVSVVGGILAAALVLVLRSVAGRRRAALRPDDQWSNS
ncbi:hypothetical protein MPY17_39645 (plasmid) [Rhodococcus opacus]|uniref:hypothetical protein n=1 Tax=Rhodococcus opacus TaxID=37919 RepID=UPI001FF3DA56|nr:hypothetical protein [Rhodococcus opacus]UOT08511.1 hypothetical protein MPY17_39645 [Rhodococcus opacus]